MRRAAGQLPGGESSRTLAWAGMGGALWLLLLPVSLDSPAESGLIVRWLLLAILVLCPLGLHLAATPDRLGQPARPYRLAVLAHPAAALLAVVSLLLAPGPLAGLLALPWLGWTLLVAGFGFWRLLPRGFVRADEACIDLGLIYLAVGGFWLLIWRLGLSLFGFGPTVAALTAVHFHVAGLVALVLAGLAGRALAATASDAERWYRPVALAVMVGPPLIALGITFSFA